MSANEGLQKLDNPTPASVDPNVRVPDHVAAGAKAAEALHEQYYPKDPAQAAAPNKEALPQPPAPEPLHSPTPEQLAAQAEEARTAMAANASLQAEQHPAPSAADQAITAEEWRHRFLSMQGRFQAQVRANAGMEEQMQALGRELVATQNMVQQLQQPAAGQQVPRGQDHGNLITDADRENYGEELIDLARRAARESVTPELDQLRQENQRLTQRVQNTGRRELFATMDGAVPNWRQINVSTQFKTWLRLPNVYTGQLRGKMLNDAVNGADAPKVIALFKDFLTEAQATGQQVPAPQLEQPELAPAPRAAAVSLETLAAPGRARPASGDTQVPSEKPIYSRAQISKFYDDSRKGLYAGREAEYRATEADMQAAQREGRIR
jgi:chemotaxis protein histidine kinase CheA